MLSCGFVPRLCGNAGFDLEVKYGLEAALGTTADACDVAAAEAELQVCE